MFTLASACKKESRQSAVCIASYHFLRQSRKEKISKRDHKCLIFYVLHLFAADVIGARPCVTQPRGYSFEVLLLLLRFILSVLYAINILATY